MAANVSSVNSSVEVLTAYIEFKNFVRHQIEEFEKIGFECTAAKIQALISIDGISFSFEKLAQRKEEKSTYSIIPGLLDHNMSELSRTCCSIIFNFNVCLKIGKHRFAFLKIDFKRGVESSQNNFERWPLRKKQLIKVMESIQVPTNLLHNL